MTNNKDHEYTLDIQAKPWVGKALPRRILAIRLQAMGDTVGALPYLQHLRKSLPPDVRLDFLTRKETDGIPGNIFLFDKVYSIGGGRSFRRQAFYSLLLLPILLFRRYDMVIDLQNNILSRTLRKILMPKAWTSYDRFSPVSGAERYRLTIEAAGLGKNKADPHFRLKDPLSGLPLLKNRGWTENSNMVVLNPAGAFETRHWPLPNYVSFARLWLKEFPKTRFLILGTSFIAKKAKFLEDELGTSLINLTGLTNAQEAFSILQHAKLIVSEDSGLLHMAWCSGIPTVALFGSTRSDWSRPLGEHTHLLDSSDLPCGNCMQSVCSFGDNHCLTRITPGEVYHHSFSLIKKLETRSAVKWES